MNYLPAFERFLMQKAPHLANDDIANGIREYVQEIYFQDPTGCLPYKYLSEDLASDIRTKFYYPLAFLEWLFKESHPELKHTHFLITIDPSYEAATNFILHVYDEKVILLEGSWNAWSFWFDDETAFEDWVNNCLKEMESGLQTVKKIRSCSCNSEFNHKKSNAKWVRKK
jgi:hypothetical protein